MNPSIKGPSTNDKTEPSNTRFKTTSGGCFESSVAGRQPVPWSITLRDQELRVCFSTKQGVFVIDLKQHSKFKAKCLLNYCK